MRISDWSSDVCSSDLWRLEKDTNSGLNDIAQTPRDDFILTANLYRQDFPFVGLTSQISATWNINREKGDIQIDHNGFPVRPALLGDLRGRDYDAVYLGYSADGWIRTEEHTSELQSQMRNH